MQEVQVDRQLALRRIDEVKRIASERNTLATRSDSATFRLAELLTEIRENRYVEEVEGRSFEDFIESGFRDERGQPRKYDWARGLVHQYRAIAQWPALVAKLNDVPRPGQPYVTFNSAYFTAKLAEMEDWKKKARKQATAEYAPGPDSPESFEARNAREHELLDGWLIEWALKTTRMIRDALSHARNEALGKKPDPSQQWPFVGGRIDPAVKATSDQLMERLVRLEDDPPSPDDMTFVQRYERVLGFCQDCIDAFDLCVRGNTGQLTALIEMFRPDRED